MLDEPVAMVVSECPDLRLLETAHNRYIPKYQGKNISHTTPSLMVARNPIYQNRWTPWLFGALAAAVTSFHALTR